MKKKSNKKVWIIAGAIIAVLAVGAANSDADDTDVPEESSAETVNYVLADTTADKE